MLAENLSETFDSRTGAEAKKGKLDALRIGLAVLGGILVLNSFLARKFFSGTIHAEAPNSAPLSAPSSSAPRSSFPPSGTCCVARSI